MMAESVRAFVAFTIDPEARRRIAPLLDHLRRGPAAKSLKCVSPENLHMTVRFFGDLDRKRLKRARAAVEALDGGWEMPRVELGELGAFPSMRRPSVFWLGLVDPGERVATLARMIDLTIRKSGFGAADKRFVPHVTIARCRRGRSVPDPERLTAGLTLPRGPLTIPTITLYQSDLRPEGPVYTPLQIARPRPGPDRPGVERPDDPTSLPPRARRTGQDPAEPKEGEPSNGGHTR
ncbi:MAG: RNA 2',3'-cyclic phosphodiesterase [Candidatus Eisenbacteria bacterium]|nr:RNA 2',3'-cyclic phosphodiesterase [Candidatus Latescibacterota bacterium]MBD3301837.1 RNA 2',3'-cyclic phosphodiesterase [Candidatus Eisenbacteria bacterium]